MSADVTSKGASANNSKENKPKVNVFKKIARYFRDLRSEFKKVVWPTRKQILNNTGVVIVFLAIAAIIIWPLDWLFIQGFLWLLK